MSDQNPEDNNLHTHQDVFRISQIFQDVQHDDAGKVSSASFTLPIENQSKREELYTALAGQEGIGIASIFSLYAKIELDSHVAEMGVEGADIDVQAQAEDGEVNNLKITSIEKLKTGLRFTLEA